MGEDTSRFKSEETKEAQKARDTDELVSVIFGDYAYDPKRDWAEFYAKFETDLDEEGQQQVLWHMERQKREQRTKGNQVDE